MHLACKYSSDKVFNLLIENNKLSLENIFNNSYTTTPLHCACRSKIQNQIIVEKMLKKFVELKLNETLQSYLDLNLRQKLINILIPIVICRFEMTTEDIEEYINEKEIVLNKFEFIRIVDETNIYLKEIVNHEDSFEARPLQLAIERNYLDITNVLFKFGALSILYAPNRTLPIHIAAKIGSVPMFWLLVKHDSVTFKTDGSMNNLFHLASFYNNWEFLKEACEYFSQNSKEKNLFNDFQFSLNTINTHYLTPLFLAISKSNINCVKVLIDSMPSSKFYVDDFGRNIFHICCFYDSYDTFEYLIQFMDKKLNERKEEDPIKVENNYESLHYGQINQTSGMNPTLKIQTYHMFNTGKFRIYKFTGNLFLSIFHNKLHQSSKFGTRKTTFN